jgi:hypothetical protein
MATQLKTLESGQTDLIGICDRLNIPTGDLISLGARVGSPSPVTFPDDFYDFTYLAFNNTVPYVADPQGGTVSIQIKCYAAPTITSSETWVTGIDTHSAPSSPYVITDVVTVGKNATGVARSSTITVTTTGPISGSTYSISTTIEQDLAPEYISQVLRFSSSSTTVCTSSTNSTVYFDDRYSFSDAPAIYTDGGITFAASGYYSDDTIWRQWSGSSFISNGTCST